jgi:sarcosine oxidase gamma subunit
MLIGKYSSSAHELLLQFLVGRSWSAAEVVDVLSHRGAGQTTLEPEGSGEGSSALRQVIAPGRGVQVRTAAVCSAVRIGYDGWAVRIRAGDHPQQLALQGPLATSDAGPDRSGGELGIRARVDDVFANHFNGV